MVGILIVHPIFKNELIVPHMLMGKVYQFLVGENTLQFIQIEISVYHYLCGKNPLVI
jgi:hypothetical protein